MNAGGHRAADVKLDESVAVRAARGDTGAATTDTRASHAPLHRIASRSFISHEAGSSPLLGAHAATPDFRTPVRGAQAQPWARSYRRHALMIDASAAGIAGIGGFLFRFGADAYTIGELRYCLLLLVMPLAWIFAIGLNGGYESRVVGAGQEEFRRIFRAFFHLCAVFSVVAFLLRADIARGFILALLPAALLLTQLGRYAARRRLHHRRRRGEAITGLLAVGDPAAIVEFDELLRRDRYIGMRVVGACLSGDSVTNEELRLLDHAAIPVLGDVDGVVDAVDLSRADVVAVLASGNIGADKLRWISWQLEGSQADMVVAPGLTEVAGARLHLQPVAGLPLLYVEEPEFSGLGRVAKAAVDRIAAAVALVVLAPVLAVIAAAVKLNSSGPVFFAQSRVGRDGTTFRIFKFRSMIPDAEERKAELMHLNESEGPLFKIADDPRVTRVGAFLRKFSLDELPQLLNVVKGEMSLVGPRPALATEVEQYADDVHRRLLVKPGLTGLGQISGRSNLKWDDAVRLDLRYIENWSFTLDLMIMWKTIGAVLRREGAY